MQKRFLGLMADWEIGQAEGRATRQEPFRAPPVQRWALASLLRHLTNGELYDRAMLPQQQRREWWQELMRRKNTGDVEAAI